MPQGRRRGGPSTCTGTYDALSESDFLPEGEMLIRELSQAGFAQGCLPTRQVTGAVGDATKKGNRSAARTGVKSDYCLRHGGGKRCIEEG